MKRERYSGVRLADGAGTMQISGFDPVENAQSLRAWDTGHTITSAVLWSGGWMVAEYTTQNMSLAYGLF